MIPESGGALGGVRVELEGWANSMIVIGSLGQRVVVETVVREFRLRVWLKGDMVGYGLEQAFQVFHFKEAGERDAVLHQ